MSDAVSNQMGRATASLAPLFRFFAASSYARLGSKPDACDFVFGNPHEMPLKEVQQALTKWAVPQDQNWFAYKMSEAHAVEVVAESIRARHGIAFETADIFMTNGAFGAIAASLRALVDPGDEVVYLSPPWFFYEPMILGLGGTPVRVELEPPGFALDVEAIEAAITPRTRVVLVNSPHNPSGRIYQPPELSRLAAVLRAASDRNGRPIYLLSDEAYSRILFDGAKFHTPLHHYDRAVLLYTYGKTLLTPGQRIGYIALPPTMPDRAEVRQAIYTAQLVTGYAFPNALMQHALRDLEKASIDIPALQRRRDRMTVALRAAGYETVVPAATFYILVRSPLQDDVAFADLLVAENVFVLPGAVFELPGWFRISLTANDEMVERALPGFARAREKAMAAA